MLDEYLEVRSCASQGQQENGFVVENGQRACEVVESEQSPAFSCRRERVIVGARSRLRLRFS